MAPDTVGETNWRATIPKILSTTSLLALVSHSNTLLNRRGMNQTQLLVVIVVVAVIAVAGILFFAMRQAPHPKIAGALWTGIRSGCKAGRRSSQDRRGTGISRATQRSSKSAHR